MKILRMVFALVLSSAVLALSMPAAAQRSTTKYGSVNFPGLLSGSGTVTIPMTVFNSTPKPGVSTMNSGWVKITNDPLTLPSGFGVARVVSLTLSSGAVDNTVTARRFNKATGQSGLLCSAVAPCTEFTISDFIGISNSQSGTFLLELVAVPDTCMNITWDAGANTGNAYPGGDEFQLTKLNMSTGCDGTLACAVFDSAGNLTNPGESSVTVGGYWDVIRHKFKGEGCPLVNYRTTVGSDTTTVTDPNGFLLGRDFFSIVYEVPPVEGVMLTHVYTSSPYPMSGGQAPKKVVKYCPPGQSCTNANENNLILTPGCLSGDVVVTAIPFLPSSTTERHPGCQRSFGWFAVAQDQCATPNDGTGCVRFQIELLEAKDPPWGLTDE